MSKFIKKILKNKFFKNSLLYTLGSMMTPLIGFIMLPVYTNYFTPSEYGIMTTIQTLMGMMQLILLLSLHGAITRFFYDFLNEPEKQREYLGSIFTFVILFSSMLSALLISIRAPLGNILFEQIPVDPYFVYLVGLSWASSLSALSMALFRAQEKAGTFITINIIKAVFISSITAYLIIGKGLGPDSALLIQLLVTLVIAGLMLGMQRKYLKFTINLSYVKQSLLFSLPLLPHVASGWIISSSDRIILEKFIDISDLGVYALAVQVSMVLALFYTSVNNALVPRYTTLRKEGKEEKAEKLLKMFGIIVTIFGVLSIPLAMLAIKFFTSNEYAAALMLTPLLLLGQIIKGYYFIPVAKLFYVKKTNAIASSSTLAAVISILVNLLAIPIIGIYGAIVSAIISEVFRYLLIRRASKNIVSSV
jgi:O-antigen/teichoic acid export membrane protein